MLIKISVLLVLIAVFEYGTNAARILMVLPIDVPSQYFLGDRLLRELASRGHEVTMISPYKSNDTVENYRKIDLISIDEVMTKMFPHETKVNFINYGHLPIWKHILHAYQTAWKITEVTLTQRAMQNLINDPNEHFDLIIFNMIFSEALFGLANKFDAPVVMLCTHVSSVWSNHLVGNPAPSSYVPDFFIGYTGKMNIMERMYNSVHNLVTEAYRKFVYFPKIDASLHTIFPDAPPLLDIMYNRTAMVLVNSHPSISDPTPHVPAMVEVGGFHVKDSKPLPKDLQDFMDNAPNGVIFFSLGSNLKSAHLDVSRRNIILNAFARLKQKVIWKFEDENLPGKPDNVKIVKWCPQIDILDMFPNEEQINFVRFGELYAWQKILRIAWSGSKVTEITLAQPIVQKMLQDPNENFDLIIFEMFNTEALYGIAHKYDAPVVVLSTLVTGIWTNHLVGNPAPSSYLPDFLIGWSGKLTLMERMYSSVHNLVNEAHRRYVYFPQIDATMHKYFPDAPPLQDIMYNRTALLLVNSHPVISDPKPYVPASIEVGGFHVKDSKPLPKDLQEFMDGAPNGVVFLSFGSNLKSDNIENSTKIHILNALSRLTQRVLWKFEDESLPTYVNNVKIIKWAPQNDVLAHPNLKLFISHGGMLSITEAIHFGVPILGIPVFGDQKTNIATIANKGYGLGLHYNEISENNLFDTIQEVITNPKYRNAVQVASQVLRNQPMRPLDSAVFWINHVVQHRGAKHFRSVALDLEWYQIYSIDIILIFLSLLLAFYYTTLFSFKFVSNAMQVKLSSIKKKKV